jgi:Porin subfamily
VSEANRISHQGSRADANGPAKLRIKKVACGVLNSPLAFMAVMAVATAQAADLPVKAKAVEYVRICSLYGAGFFYIPGTDTCIKLGGYLRAGSTFNGNIYNGPAWSSDLSQGNRFRDMINSRSRMGLTVDTRTATEYGLLRTFFLSGFQFNNFSTSNPAVLAAPASALTGLSGSVSNSPGGGYVEVEFLFIQFAGFTFGRSASAYATPWHGYPGNNGGFLIGVTTPSPAWTTSNTALSSATACRPPSVSMIRPCLTALRCTTCRLASTGPVWAQTLTHLSARLTLVWA